MTCEQLRGSGGIQWPCHAEYPEGSERLYADHEFNDLRRLLRVVRARSTRERLPGRSRVLPGVGAAHRTAFGRALHADAVPAAAANELEPSCCGAEIPVCSLGLEASLLAERRRLFAQFGGQLASQLDAALFVTIGEDRAAAAAELLVPGDGQGHDFAAIRLPALAAEIPFFSAAGLRGGKLPHTCVDLCEEIRRLNVAPTRVHHDPQGHLDERRLSPIPPSCRATLT